MKKIVEHLGEIILSVASIALIVGVILTCATPVKEFTIGVFNKLEETAINIFDKLASDNDDEDPPHPETPENPPADTLAAGLYQNGRLTRTWSDLLADDTIEVEDGAIIGCNSEALTGDLVIIDDGSVTCIADSSFDSALLNSITVPAGVTIDTYAFESCCDLQTITLARNTTINGCLGACLCSLETIQFKGTVAEWDAVVSDVQWMSGLAMAPTDIICSDGEYIIPGLYDAVGDLNGTWVDLINSNIVAEYTWENNTSMSVLDLENLQGTLVMPNSITYTNTTFEECDNLVGVVVPGSVTVVGVDTFAFCDSLESVTLKEGVTELHDAFGNCPSLTTVKLPVSLTYISAYAFWECSSLQTIIYAGTMAQWNEIDLEDEWYYNTPLLAIICTDGIITLE